MPEMSTGQPTEGGLTFAQASQSFWELNPGLSQTGTLKSSLFQAWTTDGTAGGTGEIVHMRNAAGTPEFALYNVVFDNATLSGAAINPYDVMSVDATGAFWTTTPGGGPGPYVQLTPGAIQTGGYPQFQLANTKSFIVQNTDKVNILSISASSTAGNYETLWAVGSDSDIKWSIGEGVNVGHVLFRLNGLSSQTELGGSGAGASLIVSYGSTIAFNKLLATYNAVSTKGWGLPSIYGTDSRTGKTSADGSAITEYAVTASGGIFEIGGSFTVTAYTSGTVTYTITWTDENGTSHTLSGNLSATGHVDFVPVTVRVQASTNITAQITGTFVATVSPVALVKQVA